MEEVKVVIQLKQGRCTIAVQEGDHDPVMEVVPAAASVAAVDPALATVPAALSVDSALAAVPAVLERARARWVQNPKNPAYKRPAPPPPSPLPPRPAAAARTPASTEPKEGLMQRLM